MRCVSCGCDSGIRRDVSPPRYMVEHGPTEAMFSSPQDRRASDYVHGRFV